MGIANSPDLDRRYSTELANHIAKMEPGESIYWRGPYQWARSAPGFRYIKTEDGGIRPAPIKGESV